jgi:antitoxin (DNA-binding transcriptional repressor) of toxin-antitoxin stability system
MLLQRLNIGHMKTLTITEARQNLGRWLKQSAAGDDIGIIWQNKIVALRPVEVVSADYAQREYGASHADLKAFASRTDLEIRRQRKQGRLRKFSGDLEKDL